MKKLTKINSLFPIGVTIDSLIYLHEMSYINSHGKLICQSTIKSDFQLGTYGANSETFSSELHHTEVMFFTPLYYKLA